MEALGPEMGPKGGKEKRKRKKKNYYYYYYYLLFFFFLYIYITIAMTHDIRTHRSATPGGGFGWIGA
jgi:hypothetical protein